MKPSTPQHPKNIHDYLPMALKLMTLYRFNNLDRMELESVAGWTYANCLANYNGKSPWGSYLWDAMKGNLIRASKKEALKGLTPTREDLGMTDKRFNEIDGVSREGTEESDRSDIWHPPDDRVDPKHVEDKIAADQIMALIAGLVGERDAGIYCEYVMYGSRSKARDGYVSLRDLACKYGVSYERVRQIICAVEMRIEHMRRKLRKEVR